MSSGGGIDSSQPGVWKATYEDTTEEGKDKGHNNIQVSAGINYIIKVK